jgi:hypothetical protein
MTTMTMDPRIAVRVDEFLTTLGRSPLADDVLGVVVSGSAARGEEIWRDGDLISDIDLMVLTRRTSPRLIGRIDELIHAHGHRGIDGGQVPVGTLARYLTLSFFEVRANGVVVSGDVDLRRLVPAIPPAGIPLWEGVRVLANRLVEHVKHDEGLIESDRVVAKSYEALSEAYLVAERRYRPSYAERLAEIERLAPDAAPRVVANMSAVLRARLGIGPAADIDVPTARADLVDGLGRIAGEYTGTTGAATAQLTRLAGSERHLRHRLYWPTVLARQGRWSDIQPTVDPVLLVWQRALALTVGSSASAQRQQLLSDWRACPQILMRRSA